MSHEWAITINDPALHLHLILTEAEGDAHEGAKVTKQS